jgi:acetyl-CoA carboxylase biotin carboxyl carrier protein
MDETERPAADHADGVQRLSAIMRDFDLDALDVRVGETTYELVRREAAPAATVVAAAAPAPVAAAALAPASGAPPSSGSVAGPNVKRVTAPVVGVFYTAASPGAEPFVTVGSHVQPGQVLCILEAMKLMNEITSDVAGTVTRIIPQNGELVSLNEELFWIE